MVRIWGRTRLIPRRCDKYNTNMESQDRKSLLHGQMTFWDLNDIDFVGSEAQFGPDSLPDQMSPKYLSSIQVPGT